MEPVTARDAAKWIKSRNGSLKGIGSIFRVLALESSEGCSCRGEAMVDDYTYKNSAVGDRVEALCHRGACYSPKDRRWEKTFAVRLWAYLFMGIACAIAEGVLLFRALGEKK